MTDSKLIPEGTAAYTALEARSFRASTLTRGPWDPNHQHAGPPIALVCRAVEQAAHEHGLTHIARLTANLLRPVPIGELIVEVMTDYVGRNAGHFSAHLMAGNKDVARFTALAQRESPVELSPALPGHPLPMAPLAPEASPPAIFPFAGRQVGYADLVVSAAVILTHFVGVNLTHLADDGGFLAAADVDPGASSGDSSVGPAWCGDTGDRAAAGMLAQYDPAVPA